MSAALFVLSLLRDSFASDAAILPQFFCLPPVAFPQKATEAFIFRVYFNTDCKQSSVARTNRVLVAYLLGLHHQRLEAIASASSAVAGSSPSYYEQKFQGQRSF